MCRCRPQLAKVIGRLDNASSEVLLPDPVYNHAGRQWMIAAGQPARECQPVTAGFPLRVRRANKVGFPGSLNTVSAPG